MDTFSSQEALDYERAYYKVCNDLKSVPMLNLKRTQDELKYFVASVCKTCIERHLVEPLPAIILSPIIVTQMSEQEIKFVAAEPPEITQQRAHLESRLGMLEKGLDTFREAMGGLRR